MDCRHSRDGSPRNNGFMSITSPDCNATSCVMNIVKGVERGQKRGILHLDILGVWVLANEELIKYATRLWVWLHKDISDCSVLLGQS